MGKTTGEKIRQLRTELGLSQKQLAGTEMTRAFLSMVENGKCMPSLETLQIIARRLGKTVEYFSGDSAEKRLPAVRLLLNSATKAREQQEFDQAAAYAAAAVELAETQQHQGIEMEARLILANIYVEQGKQEIAYEQYEVVLDAYRNGQDPAKLASVHHFMGVCAHSADDFQTAKRHYRRVLRLTEGRKSLQELRVKVLINLAGCHLRLGENGPAQEASQEAVNVARTCSFPHLLAAALNSLGSAYRSSGQWALAKTALEDAVSLLERSGDRHNVAPLHNLGITMADLGDWESAKGILEECLQRYQEQGNMSSQASALEEIGRYYLHHLQLDEAERACMRGLELLDIQDRGTLRGRLYRLLGQVMVARKSPRATDCFRTSLEIFRRLHTPLEAAKTLEAMTAAITGDGHN